MATLTVSLVSTPLTGSKTYTVSDADVSRLITYMQNKYRTESSTPTPQQALLLWVQDWISGTANSVQASGITQNVPAPPVFT